MSDSALGVAAEIYSPFDIRETCRLRGYVSDVEELVGSAFFQPGEQKLTLSAEMGGPLQSTLVYPGEEAVQPSRAHELPPDHQAAQPPRARARLPTPRRRRGRDSKLCASGRRTRCGRPLR